MSIIVRPNFGLCSSCLGAVFMLLAAMLGLAVAQTGEHPALLYASDGAALYRVNPNSGHLHLLGSFKIDGSSLPADFVLTGMSYDAHLRQLFVTGWFPAPSGRGDSKNVLYSVAPGSLEFGGPMFVGPQCYQASYDWLKARLCLTREGEETAHVSVADPLTGKEVEIARVAGRPSERTFFDPRGHFWIFAIDDWWATFRESSLENPDGRTLAVLEDFIYDPGQSPNGNWPVYQSFAFHPHTGALFATFRRGVNGSIIGDQYVSLCTVDLATGKPHKIVATYDQPNLNLYITWAP